jgi:hypothetical protein
MIMNVTTKDDQLALFAGPSALGNQSPDRASDEYGRQCLAAKRDAERCVHGVEGPHAHAEQDRDNGR